MLKDSADNKRNADHIKFTPFKRSYSRVEFDTLRYDQRISRKVTAARLYHVAH